MDGCSSCCLTSSVKALKGTQNTDPNQWPGLFLCTTWLLVKGVLLPVCWLMMPVWEQKPTLSANYSFSITLVVVLLSGDNLLAIVRAIIDSQLLADPAEYRHGHVIYFDFVGLFMVILPVRLGTLVDVVAIFFVVLRFAAKLLKSGHGKCWQLFVINFIGICMHTRVHMRTY